MKITRFFAVFLLFATPFAASAQPGHAITVHLKGYHQGMLYLGNFYGKQTFLTDSVKMNNQGTAVFRGTDTLPGGIYFVLLPQKRRYFEMLVDRQQHFSVDADTTDGFRKLVFSGSADNEQFGAYNAFLRAEQQKAEAAKKAHADSAAMAGVQQDIKKEIASYRDHFRTTHPGTLLAMIFGAMDDPVIPDPPKGLSPHEDSTFKFYYFKKHYWDNVDFSDSRILYTPVMETRLHRYFSQLVVAEPDSVDQAADEMLARVGSNREMFKFMLWWLTDTYGNSRYMGMDAVFVHLVEKYYMTGQAYWLTKEQTQKLISRASQIAPNLIGNTAPNLALKTPELKNISLWDVKSPYTILVFWDPTCGHCQITVPKLDSAYEHHWKKEGVKMMGVLAGGTKKQWLDFIHKYHMEDWVNAWDPDKTTNYRRLYDVYMTPIVYLLDAHKKILAKKLDVKQLDQFLDHLRDHPKAYTASAD